MELKCQFITAGPYKQTPYIIYINTPTLYLNAMRVATQYEKQIVPQAQSAYDLYRTSFRAMAAAYPQVLIAQRTLFQVRVEYVHALVNTWQNAVLLRGYLLNGALDAPGGQSGITMEGGNPAQANDRD